MQIPNYFRVAVMCIAILLPALTRAQNLSTEEKTQAIQAIAKNIAVHYHSPDLGGQIASHIQVANHRGDFKKTASWKEFSEAVTASLRKFSNDQHLYVKYDPAQVKALRSPDATVGNRMYAAGDDNGEQKEVVAEWKVVDGNLGYIKFGDLNISKQQLPAIYEAMRKVENTDALIIDLRDNRGGSSEMGAVLESYFLPAGIPLLEYNSRDGKSGTISTVNWLEEKKYEKPVYVLINRNTASAAEALAFVLQQKKRAKIVGEPSAGAAYMNEWFVLNDQLYISVSTSLPHLSGTDINWQGSGVRPDIKVKNGEAMQAIIAAQKN